MSEKTEQELVFRKKLRQLGGETLAREFDAIIESRAAEVARAPNEKSTGDQVGTLDEDLPVTDLSKFNLGTPAAPNGDIPTPAAPNGDIPTPAAPNGDIPTPAAFPDDTLKMPEKESPIGEGPGPEIPKEEVPMEEAIKEEVPMEKTPIKEEVPTKGSKSTKGKK